MKDHSLLGKVKLVEATAKTYVVFMKDKKWTHLVSVYDKDRLGSEEHLKVGRKLFHKISKYDLNKEEAEAMRELLLRPSS